MDADLRLSLIYGTSSSGIILAPRRKRAGVFLKGGVRHNRNIGYKSHLTFLSAWFQRFWKYELKLAGKGDGGRGWSQAAQEAWNLRSLGHMWDFFLFLH